MESETITKRLSDKFIQGFPDNLQQNHNIWYRLQPDENGILQFVLIEKNGFNS